MKIRWKLIVRKYWNEDQATVIFAKIVEFIVAQPEIDFDDRKTFERKETTDLLIGRYNEMKQYIAK